MREPMYPSDAEAESAPSGSLPPGGNVQEILLSRISDDPANSPRLRLSRSRIAAFARIMQEQGVEAFPPVVLAGPREDGAYEIIDGRHRVAAALLAGVDRIPARVNDWTTDRECSAAALRLSARNGLPLTNHEKRQAVLRLLREFPERSTRQLGEMAATSHAMVALCKKEMARGLAPSESSRRPPTNAARTLVAEKAPDLRQRARSLARMILEAAEELEQIDKRLGDGVAARALADAALEMGEMPEEDDLVPEALPQLMVGALERRPATETVNG